VHAIARIVTKLQIQPLSLSLSLSPFYEIAPPISPRTVIKVNDARRKLGENAMTSDLPYVTYREGKRKKQQRLSRCVSRRASRYWLHSDPAGASWEGRGAPWRGLFLLLLLFDKLLQNYQPAASARTVANVNDICSRTRQVLSA